MIKPKIGDQYILGPRDMGPNRGKIFTITTIIDNDYDNVWGIIDDGPGKEKQMYIGKGTTFDLYKRKQVKTNKPNWF